MTQLSLFDPIQIPLTKGYVAIVDPVDADLASLKWSTNMQKARPYAFRRDGTYIHRVILSRKIGYELTRFDVVDHINGNTCDNRRDNLRLATIKQNLRNQKRRETNTSGFKGVSFLKTIGKWQSKIVVDGKQIYNGFFDSPIEAAHAYDEAARRYFGEFARCNFKVSP